MAFDKPQSRNEAILQNMLGANNELEPPKSRVEALLQELSGQMPEANPSEGTTTGTLERLKIGDDIYTVEGGGSGTSDYDALNNKPQIASVTLSGDKSLADLGIASATTVSGILDGTDIDSFGDVETALAGKQDTLTFDNVPTENSNNPVKSGGVKSAIDAAVSRCYHHAGTKTCAELVAGLLVAANEGNVYNMTDSGTTTADFIEGAGQPIKAGDNVGIAKISDGVYKFDLLSGFVDTANFVQKSETAGLLKNDGTVDTTIQGDVSTLKSGLTTLDNEVNGDATTYPYADVITIEDAVPSNLADCNVKIEPVQDLHGYDHPWVGGAYTNKYDDSTKLENKMLLSGGNYYDNSWFDMSDYIDVTGNDGYVTMSWDSTIAWYQVQLCAYDSSKQFISGSYINYETDNARTHAFVVPNNAKYVRFSWAKQNAGGSVGQTNIRVNLGNTDLGYAPYTNICPITGHTEASVQRDGKNHFDVNGSYINRQGAGGTYTVSGNSITVKSSTQTSAFAGFIKPLEVGETYAISYTSTSKIRIIQIDEPISVITQGYYGTDTDSGTSFVASKPYVLINCVGDTSGVTYSNIQLEKGSSATDYEPYAGKTYTIALGDTIYGGTVDFDSGVMKVTHKLVDLSTLSWYVSGAYEQAYLSDAKALESDDVAANALCEKYHIVARTATDNTGDAAIDTQKYLKIRISESPTGNICYELATPTTIQLTPQQIQLLKGTNTLTASTGQISVTVNGVSGSIGAVQEQVNELAEDVSILNQNDCKSKYLISYSASNQKVKVGYTFGAQVFAIIGKSYINSSDQAFCFIVTAVNGTVPGNERVLIKDACGNYSSITATISNGYLEFEIGSYAYAMVLSSHDFTAKFETIE